MCIWFGEQDIAVKVYHCRRNWEIPYVLLMRLPLAKSRWVLAHA